MKRISRILRILIVVLAMMIMLIGFPMAVLFTTIETVYHEGLKTAIKDIKNIAKNRKYIPEVYTEIYTELKERFKIL